MKFGVRSFGASFLMLGLVLTVACSTAATQVSPTPGPTPQPTASPTPREATGAPNGGASTTPTQEPTATQTPEPSQSTPTLTDDTSYRDLEIITLLAYDATRAILDPKFVTGDEAHEQYSENELVLGVSINGDHRAYSIPFLSFREIVNDVVGGVPVAVTW